MSLFELNLTNLVKSLSIGLDLIGTTNVHSLATHNLRVAYIALQIGKELQYNDQQLHHLYLTSLLHDIGVSTESEKVKLLNVDVNGSYQHCSQGYQLLSSFKPFSSIALSIKHHHDKWNDTNESGLVGDDIPLDSLIIHLADRIDITLDYDHYLPWQKTEVLEKIKKLGSTYFKPELIDIVNSLIEKISFWLDLGSHHLDEILQDITPNISSFITLNDLHDFSKIFAKVIDSKSPFTREHSIGVAKIAKALAQSLDWENEACSLIEVAGLLHDVGKLSITNQILDKPDKLTPTEYAVMKSHTYHTYQVLNRIDNFNTQAKWAAYHHERLDGKGYPFHIKGNDLDMGCRIMAIADIFQALNQNRPYRPGMSQEQVLKIMCNQVNEGALDGDMFNLIEKEYDKFLLIGSSIDHSCCSNL